MTDPFLRVHAVNIYVKDQERSLDFYLNTLGFRIAFDARVGSGERLLAVAPPDGTAVLTLIQAHPDAPQARFVGRTTQVVFVTENMPAPTPSGAGEASASGAPRAFDGLSTSRPRRRRRFRRPRRRGRTVRRGAVFSPASRTSIGTRLLWSASTRSAARSKRNVAPSPRAAGRAAVGPRLEIAMQVQARLFPQRLPAMRTLEYAGACVQTRRVGGGLYDFLISGRPVSGW